MFPATFKFCRLSQLRKGSGCAKRKARVWAPQTKTLMESIEAVCPESPPKLEILLADKLSTERCRRDDNAAKLVIWFPVRSSLSRFMHSPMQPRSCIPARGGIYYYTCGDETLGCQWILTLAPQFQEQYGLQVKLPSSWLEQRRGDFVTVSVWKGRGTKAGQSGADFLCKSELIIRESAPQKHKMPQALSVLFITASNLITQAVAYAFSWNTYLATCWSSHRLIPGKNNTIQLSSVLWGITFTLKLHE